MQGLYFEELEKQDELTPWYVYVGAAAAGVASGIVVYVGIAAGAAAAT